MNAPRALAVVMMAAAMMVGATAAAVGAPVRGGQAERAPAYYVAVGDSLAQGYMPGGSGSEQPGVTDRGYVDDLYAHLHAADPALRLVKFGCPGESTTTMISGGICTYQGAASQLDAAERFLRAHRGDVAYVTLDIGANDVDGCATSAGIDDSCVQAGLKNVLVNLPRITTGLRLAGGVRPVYAGMTIYDPFLAAWLTGSAGRQEAHESAVIVDTLNGIERVGYAPGGFRVADVAGAFRTNDFADTTSLPGAGTVPVNVAVICSETYMCTQGNIHPTASGYALIATAFEAILPK